MQRLDFDPLIYVKAIAVLLRNPIILVFPLAAAVIDLALNFISNPLFDPLGGMDFGIMRLVAILLDGFAFGLAVIAAEYAWRSNRARFAAAWQEGKGKAGSILIATLGFAFVLFVAQMIGGYLGLLGLLLVALAFVFLVYTIPAAAIGGIPGGAALSVSVQKVRAAPLPAIVLAIVFIILYGYALEFLGPYIADPLGVFAPYVLMVLRAVIVGYLAVVSARQYDEISFFRRY